MMMLDGDGDGPSAGSRVAFDGNALASLSEAADPVGLHRSRPAETEGGSLGCEAASPGDGDPAGAPEPHQSDPLRSRSSQP